MGRFGAIWAALTFLAGPAAMGVGLVTVTQRGRAFSASELEVAPGDVVRFKNEDGFLHQVFIESPRLAFESAEQAPGESVDVRFPSSGTFDVRCHIHPKMLLHVHVR